MPDIDFAENARAIQALQAQKNASMAPDPSTLMSVGPTMSQAPTPPMASVDTGPIMSPAAPVGSSQQPEYQFVEEKNYPIVGGKFAQPTLSLPWNATPAASVPLAQAQTVAPGAAPIGPPLPPAPPPMPHRAMPHAAGPGGPPREPGLSERQKAILGTYTKEGELAGKEGELNADKIYGEAKGLRDSTVQYDQEMKDIEEGAKRQAAKNADYLQRTQQLSDQIAQQKIDPHHYFAEASTGKKIALIASAALGGFLAGGTGGPNLAVKHMEDEMDRDINVQKSNIDNARQGVAMRRSIYGDMVQATDNDTLRQLGAKKASLEAAKQIIGAEAMRYDSDLARARAGELMNTIDRQSKGLEDNMIEAMKAAQARAAAAAASARGAADDKMWKRSMEVAHLNTEQMKAGKDSHDTQTKEQQELQGRWIPALGGFAASAQDAKEIKERTAAMGNLQAGLQEAARLREEIGATGMAWNDMTPGTNEKVARLKSLVQKLKPQFSVAFGQGAAGESESKRYEEAMGGLLNYTGNPAAIARQMSDDLGNDAKRMANTYGVTKDPYGFAAQVHTNDASPERKPL